ncbi:unnamed protein product [Coregonus sp. 'balchen']|nr:unnamed protein product [Coregonus sp. 'balchen']
MLFCRYSGCGLVVPEKLQGCKVLYLDSGLGRYCFILREGLSGALYWRDLVSLVHKVGFTTPYLVTASHITVHNSELQKKASGITYASATCRHFKLPKNRNLSNAVVAYKLTVPDHPNQLKFDIVLRCVSKKFVTKLIPLKSEAY